MVSDGRAEEKIDLLWSRAVFPFLKREATEFNKLDTAFESLEKLREHFNVSSKNDEKLELLQQALLIVQLISRDHFGWIVDAIEAVRDAEVDYANVVNIDARQHLVQAMYLVDEAAESIFRDELWPAIVPMSKDVFLQLKQGMEALEKGEVRDIVRPSSVARRGPAWSLDRARVRAVQHVLFIHGQGSTKNRARQRVSAAMTNVGSETLRAWEERDFQSLADKHAFRQAEAAGRMAVKIADANERLTLELHEADVYRLMQSLQGENLGAFGKSYDAVKRDGR